MRLNIPDLLRLYQYKKAIDRAIKAVPWDDPLTAKMYYYAIGSGHRSRSIAALLSYNLFSNDWKRAIPAAKAIELGHKASLIHDDLIDGDKYRGRKPTFHSIYGSEASVIMGDLLMGTAFELLDTLKFSCQTKLDCYKIFSNAFRVSAYGELKDINFKGNTSFDLNTILEIHYWKTGKLGELALKVGGLLGGGSVEEVDYLGQIGKKLGVTFQIINDINNWTGYEIKNKRYIKSDVNNCRPNIISCFQSFNSLDTATYTISSHDHNTLPYNSNYEAFEKANALVEQFCQEARNLTKKLPPSHPRNILYKLTFRNNIFSNFF